MTSPLLDSAPDPAPTVVPFVARPPRRDLVRSEPPARREKASEPGALGEEEGGPDGDHAVADLAAGVDFGPLAPLMADQSTTDIVVNADGAVWVDRGRGMEPRDQLGLPPPVTRELAVRLIAAGGRHVDESTPCVDVRLGNGIRVHVVLPPISPRGPAISVRLPRRDPLSFDQLVDRGCFAAVGADAVRGLVTERRNLLVTGAGGSGKTTLLAALLGCASPAERIVVIEDVAELQIDHPHVVSLEARQANLEGAGAIGLDRLVREALRMRPDRLVVGECRGPELRELLSALNTGHDGGAGTLHANSLADVPSRLEALAATAGIGPGALARQAVSAFHAVAHIERTPGGRRVAALGRLDLTEDGRLTVVERREGRA